MLLLVLITATLIVHFHIDKLVLIVLLIARAVAPISATLTAASVRFGVLFLLHPFVFGASVLEPYFDLQRKKEE